MYPLTVSVEELEILVCHLGRSGILVLLAESEDLGEQSVSGVVGVGQGLV